MQAAWAALEATAELLRPVRAVLDAVVAHRTLDELLQALLACIYTASNAETDTILLFAPSSTGTQA